MESWKPEKFLMNLDKVFGIKGSPMVIQVIKMNGSLVKCLSAVLGLLMTIYTAGYPTSDPDEIMDRIGANETTRNLVNSFSSRKDQFIALMCSPELMGLENA
jgi:hypothetical protein